MAYRGTVWEKFKEERLSGFLVEELERLKDRRLVRVFKKGFG